MIDPTRFDEFVQNLHGHQPFPWQRRLAQQVATGDWPGLLDLPTASGKTSILDVFVFGLACQAHRPAAERTVPRRMAFVVDRRVIVDEAFERARKLRDSLQSASDGVLGEVAIALRELAASDTPLQCFQLRGGMYRDDTWARAPTQPTILTCTVDQIGSRLLFRSYGASRATMYAIHAGLAANDMLIVLDEAHCAKPFEQTAAAISRYRQKSTVALPVPFRFVTMTATPQSSEPPFGLNDEDRKNPVLHARLNASKPAQLVQTEDDIVEELVKQAEVLVQKGLHAVGIMVNRVKTARAVHTVLQAKHGDHALLLIGRMRPFDRDRVQQSELFKQLLADKSKTRQLEQPVFVVATQTLEVGANLDFDGLVTECASLDALRQRFGRLNRIGRAISAEGVIVISADQTKDSSDDPVYGPALANTWQWLNKHAIVDAVTGKAKKVKKLKSIAATTHIDLGIDALTPALKSLSGAVQNGESLRAAKGKQKKGEKTFTWADVVQNTADAPIMLPAHIDAWAQTAPMPIPEPDISIFLHGPQRGSPEVKLVWRADLAGVAGEAQWIQAVALCPPTSVEALSVPLYLVRAWLADRHSQGENVDADIEGVQSHDETDHKTESLTRRVLVWRGPDDSFEPTSTKEIGPNDTLVIPAKEGGWERFGHLLNDAIDIAEPARWQAKRDAVIRLHPSVLCNLPESDLKDRLLSWANANTNVNDDEDPPESSTVLAALRDLPDIVPAHMHSWAHAFALAKRLKLEAHPISGWVAKAMIPRTSQDVEIELSNFTDEGDSSSLLEDALTGTVLLQQHTDGVMRFGVHFARTCGLPEPILQDFELAGKLHDLGKADPRFQRWLYGCAELRYTPLKPLIAKSSPRSDALRWRAQAESGYPKGSRHELLSVKLIQDDASLKAQANDWELVLHLIASHHGHCRPFAPIVTDDEPVTVCITAEGRVLSATSRTELERFDSGIAERFWQLTRKYGWWGLAYLEAIFRLADHQQSARDTALKGES